MPASEELKQRIRASLVAAFGEVATVHLFDGYADNIHVWVVSPHFQGVPEYLRQERVWDALDAALPDHEKVRISLILCFAPDEPEYGWALREHDIASK